MPPEQHENRDRQLAALRRYVSDLDVRRQGNGGQTREREGRRVAWPWLLVTLVLAAVSLGGGIAIGARGDPGPDRASAVAGATATSAPSPTASPECAEAVERANLSISHAVRLSGALREHTAIMNDLLNGKISAETALRTGTPSLIAGSAASAEFDVALADYRRVVDRCQLRSS
jgi:hypothetical protein